MWRNFRLLYMTDVKKFKICPHVETFLHLTNMWKNLKVPHIWHVCDVENVSINVQSMFFLFVKLSLSRFAIYAPLCGDKFNHKLRMCRKYDKNEVWMDYYLSH